MSRASRFLDACWRKPVDRTPVWFMRQAGRYQASYQALRAKHSFLTMCRTPELAARITVSPVDEVGVDAAILFSDILILVEAMGAEIAFTEAGPRLERTVRTASDIAALDVADPYAATPYVLEAVRQTRRDLDGRVPLIGFAGAPLTLASYLVEGGNSKSFTHLRQLLFGQPEAAHQLLDRLARSVSNLLRAQVEAGCQAVQLFDSWAGILGPEDYRTFGLPYIRRILESVRPYRVPRIIFGTGTQGLLELLGRSGAEVVGVDWRTDLAEARRRLGPDLAVQGNLDPGCLFMGPPALEQRVAAVLDSAGEAPGHIFNLGHGVLPPTPQDTVRRVVRLVHRLSGPAHAAPGAGA